MYIQVCTSCNNEHRHYTCTLWCYRSVPFAKSVPVLCILLSFHLSTRRIVVVSIDNCVIERYHGSRYQGCWLVAFVGGFVSRRQKILSLRSPTSVYLHRHVITNSIVVHTGKHNNVKLDNTPNSKRLPTSTSHACLWIYTLDAVTSANWVLDYAVYAVRQDDVNKGNIEQEQTTLLSRRRETISMTTPTLNCRRITKWNKTVSKQFWSFLFRFHFVVRAVLDSELRIIMYMLTPERLESPCVLW